MVRRVPYVLSRPSHPPFLFSSPCQSNILSLRQFRPSPWSHSRVSMGSSWRMGGICFYPSSRSLVPPILCSKKESNEVETTHTGDAKELFSDSDERKSESKWTKAFSSNEMMQSLKRYGVAGVLSYGLLNTVYYLTTFLLVWFYFAPAPGKMGYSAAVQRFLKVLATVWAGSQVTKIVRAAGALALAPVVDQGLSWFTIKFKFESEGKAFAAIAGLCFGLALLLFFGLTLLSA